MTGSSPRIRGESKEAIGTGLLPGIIPANTGRICSVRCRRLRTGDHPREYGENTNILIDHGYLAGSSPRIRGEYMRDNHLRIIRGIIPANTGRIAGRLCTHGESRDHPREYGENSQDAVQQAMNDGSSPRIRGESLGGEAPYNWSGIIPANTGRMTHPTPGGAPPPDHPREYGENPQSQPALITQMGSSPRIRGEFRRVALTI